VNDLLIWAVKQLATSKENQGCQLFGEKKKIKKKKKKKVKKKKKKIRKKKKISCQKEENGIERSKKKGK